MNEGTIAALNATNEQLERDLADARRALWLVLRMAPNCTVRIPKTMLDNYDRSTCVITGSLDGDSDNVRLSAASLAPPNAEVSGVGTPYDWAPCCTAPQPTTRNDDESESRV